MYLHGHCEGGLERVRDALAEILASGVEVGAALAVYVDGHAVVDLWGGHADAARTRPWERDTIVNLYSVGKAVTAVCALRLVDAGVLDLDAPVARYWPEFAQAGKTRLPVRYLLTHQAALPAVACPLPSDAWSRWDVMTEALAAQASWWEPGAGHGYHVNAQGSWSARSCGASPARRSAPICARTSPAPPASTSPSASVPSSTDAAPTRCRPRRVPRTRNASVCYSALAGNGALDGVHLLSPELIARAAEEQVYGDDIVLQRPTRFGPGFQLTMAERPLGPNPRAFGHFGAGGSLGFADPDARVAIGDAMNRGGSAGSTRTCVIASISSTPRCSGIGPKSNGA